MITPDDIHNARILIVDDQKANILLLDRVLRAAGYAFVASTMDPTEVCEIHRHTKYDLILLDLAMPLMDGFAVMEGLKEIEQDGYLPVLVLTAEPDHKLRALQAGARDFLAKPFDLAEVLMRVQNMLEVRLLHLETKRLYEAVLAEKKVSERLLLNVLPRSVAERLKADPGIIADSFRDVSVLFADIVGFTELSENLSPEELVALLNEVFSLFDGIAERRGLEKIKTIGDAYMAVAGVPTPVADHAGRAAHMALDMLQALQRFNAENGYELQLRIGIHSGAAVAGVIGKSKFIYDLWGDAVNTASRMESQGVVAHTQVTEATRRQLGEEFEFEERGAIDIKGKGEMRTWLLTGCKNAEPAAAQSLQ
jgi:adenylate cyclase